MDFIVFGRHQMPTIIIDYDACVPCGDCVECCTVRLLVEEIDDDGNVIVKPRSDRVEKTEKDGSKVEYYSPGCSNCRVCYITCPCEAIDIIPELED
jgi:NAD-dependent dihydropyrimidine dehydrogenase PreA subunit